MTESQTSDFQAAVEEAKAALVEAEARRAEATQLEVSRKAEASDARQAADTASKPLELIEEQERDLDEAFREPLEALEEALDAVRELRREDVDEVRRMVRPPPLVEQVLKAVYLMLNAQDFAASGDLLPGVAQVPWETVCRMLKQKDFLPRVRNFDLRQLEACPRMPSHVASVFLGRKGESQMMRDSSGAGAVAGLGSLDSTPSSGGETSAAPLATTSSPAAHDGAEGAEEANLAGESGGGAAGPMAGRQRSVSRRRSLMRRASFAHQQGGDAAAGDHHQPALTHEVVAYASKAAGALYKWANSQLTRFDRDQALAPHKAQAEALAARRRALEEAAREAQAAASRASSGEEMATLEKEAAQKEAEAARAALNEAEERLRQAKGEEHDGVRLDSARKETEEAQSAAAAARARTGRAGKGRVAQLACTDVVIKQTLTFEAGRAVVQDLNTPAMLGVISILRDHPEMKINVQGRADDADGGDSEFKLRLSKDRAEACCNWLVSLGAIALGRIRTSTVAAPPEAPSNGTNSSGSNDEGDWHVRFNVIREITIRDRIDFDGGSSTLRSESKDVLDGVARVMKRNRDIKLLHVEGHSCTDGPEDWNLELSKDRARSVLDYLISCGVSPSRITPQGYGPNRPLHSNTTITGRRSNRRVEFLVMDS